jgi:hypothetical protein
VLAFLLPAQAFAHGGQAAPVATSFVAHLTNVPAGVDARVVDGDQGLWLRTDPRRTVVVLGFQGEPYLRFSSAGVEANESSPAYYLNRARPQAVPRGLDALATARWQRVARGRTYSWHDDRLHALAASARQPGSDLVGGWTIPLRVDGQRTQLSGTLRYASDPSPVWFWPIAVVLLSLPALLRLRRRRLDATLVAVLAAVTLAAVVAGRIGRDLYGRPGVSVRDWVGLGLTCVVALLLTAGLRSREWRTVAAVLVGSAGVYEGISLLGMLLHGHVLSALPADAARAAAASCLAGGSALLLVTLAGQSAPAPQLTRAHTGPETRWSRRGSNP